MLGRHGLPVLQGEPRGGEEAHIGAKKYFQQIGDCIHGIRVVAVQGDYDVSLRLEKPRFVGTAVSADLLVNDPGAQAVGKLRGPVRGIIVYDDDLIHERRHTRKDFDNAYPLRKTSQSWPGRPCHENDNDTHPFCASPKLPAPFQGAQAYLKKTLAYSWNHVLGDSLQEFENSMTAGASFILEFLDS